MKQELLIKYISGKASQAEKEEVSAWIDEDAAHLKSFLSLRRSYDAFLWEDVGDLCKQAEKKKTRFLHLTVQKVLQIAAVFVVSFGLGYAATLLFSQDEMRMQTVYVPAGQRTKITLADGTEVWVNGKTTLTFPDRFGKHTRQVALDGEAYFDVKKDAERQFIVNTAHRSAIKVLGTRFNLCAYKEADEVITTLLEGKVDFEYPGKDLGQQHVILMPQQKLVFNARDGKVTLTQTSGERELAWKDGKIILRQTSLRDALALLAERYNAEFVVRDNVPSDDRFTGTFTNRNLEQILSFISASSNVHWRYLNNDGRDEQENEKIKIEIFI